MEGFRVVDRQLGFPSWNHKTEKYQIKGGKKKKTTQ